MEQRPEVGMGIFVIRENKILLGKRKNAHGENHWGLPGGHLEFMEELNDCARREVLEETGMKIKNVRFAAITNDIFEEEGKHYVTIFMVADHDSGEPKILEPDRMIQWGWFARDNLPQPLFLPIRNLIRQGFDLFDRT